MTLNFLFNKDLLPFKLKIKASPLFKLPYFIQGLLTLNLFVKSLKVITRMRAHQKSAQICSSPEYDP